MIADQYLQLRQEVEAGLGELLKFAAELRRPGPILDSLHGLLTNIREPLLFVVVGEVKAGKSSLINALFGQEIARTDVLPATDRVCIYRYGREQKVIEQSARLIESHLPIDFLQNFNVVDTPGTNTMVSEHQTITENFVPRADLILFVFSVVNPWTQSAWDFLKFVQKKWLKNVVFVLQQADLRDPKEVEVIRRHLHESAMERLGVSVPIFAVSARKALLSRTSAVDKERLWNESQFAGLEHQINLIVSEGSPAILKFRSANQTAQVILGEINKELEESMEVIDRDEKRLTRIQQFISTRQEQTSRQISGLLRDIEKVCRDAVNEGYRLLEQKLSFWRTWKLIWNRADWQREFQMELEMKLRQRVQPAVEHAVQMLEVDLRSVWPQLSDSVDTLLATELRSQAPRTIHDFAQKRRELLQAVHLALIERVSGKSIEEKLARLFTETSSRLRVPTGVAAASGLVALIAAMSSAAVADITGILAASAAVTGSVVVFRQRRKILQLYSEQMEAKCAEVIQLIEEQLKRAVDLFYQEITVSFQPLAAFCESRRSEYEPKLKRIKELQPLLEKLAYRLR
jgi:GTPase Era involved in 16S rRNA processing